MKTTDTTSLPDLKSEIDVLITTTKYIAFNEIYCSYFPVGNLMISLQHTKHYDMLTVSCKNGFNSVNVQIFQGTDVDTIHTNHYMIENAVRLIYQLATEFPF